MISILKISIKLLVNFHKWHIHLIVKCGVRSALPQRPSEKAKRPYPSLTISIVALTSWFSVEETPICLALSDAQRNVFSTCTAMNKIKIFLEQNQSIKESFTTSSEYAFINSFDKLFTVLEFAAKYWDRNDAPQYSSRRKQFYYNFEVKKAKIK